MKKILTRHRRGASETIHGVLAAAALALGFLLRFEFTLDPIYRKMLAEALPFVLGVKLTVFRAFGLRDLTWRFLGFEDLLRIVKAAAVASLASSLALRVVIGSAFPRSIYVLDLLLCLTLLTGVRAGGRLWFDRRSGPRDARALRRILIYGAGQAGMTVYTEIRAHPELGYVAAGFVDDHPDKRHLRLKGARVLGNREELPDLVRRHRVDEVLLALPAASGSEIAAILARCRTARVATRKIPPLAELIGSQGLVQQVREVRLEDLLGRPPVDLDETSMGKHLAGQVVLVTGAGGSIGSELCRQIARYRPAALVGLDQAETTLYQIDLEMRERFPQTEFHPEVGSIQDRRRLNEIFGRHRPGVVYHAAAYKHVPMMERHLFEAVENNIFGTRNLERAAVAFEARTFVLISSDKAVRPASVMGATKRVAELICLAAGERAGQTRFLAVRFGNVLGSNGSVIPLFQRQIAAGGPVTVTHPGMRRFFMTIPEAAQLVLQSAALDSRGEIFLLEMGAPVPIVDLARNMILLSGLRPDQDIRIEFTGPRPGEKLNEDLQAREEDTLPTPHAQIRIFAGSHASREGLSRCLEDLQRSVETRDAASAVFCLKEIIPDYNPSVLVLRQAFGGNRDTGAALAAAG